MVRPVFYHDYTDGHTSACSSMENPVVLFGVHNLPHQHHRLVSAERERQGKRQLETTNTRINVSSGFHFFAVSIQNKQLYWSQGPTLTSIPKIGWKGKKKPR